MFAFVADLTGVSQKEETRLSEITLKKSGLAVREGFEPSVQFDPYDGLANRSFRPLRHLTESFPPLGVAKIGIILSYPKVFWNKICRTIELS